MSNNYDPKVLKDLQLFYRDVEYDYFNSDKNQITYCLIGGTALEQKGIVDSFLGMILT